jgi:hypothetical protein
MTRNTNFSRTASNYGQDAGIMPSRPPMKHIQPRLSVSLLALAVIGGAGCNQNSGMKYDGGISTEEATITITPTVASFANTAIGKDSEVKKFTVTNIGYLASGAVSPVVDGISASEFVVVGSTCGQPLPYNGACDVSVLFRPVTSGSKSARLNVNASPGGSALVTMSATSQSSAAATINPMIGSFPAVPINAANSSAAPMFQMIAFTVTNTGGTATYLSSSIDGQDAGDFKNSDGCSGQSLQPNATCGITVFFSPTTAGLKSADLNVTGDAVKLSVPLSGNASNPAMLMLSPTTQDFGTVQFGTTNTQQFVITNMGGQMSGKVNAAIVGSSGAGFSISNSTCTDAMLNPGDTCTVLVTFTPIASNGVGMKTGLLTVAAPMSGNLTATLTGNAVTNNMLGMLALTSPGGTDPFGQVSVGATSTALFQVQNNGTLAAGKVMATLAGSGNDFSIAANGCPDTLDIGAACFVTVTFQPTTIGRKTATLQVLANPGGFGTLAINGNALAGPALQISPTFSSFGTHRVGTNTGATPTTFTVRNVGTDVSGQVMVQLEGADAGNFQLVATDCQNITLQRSGPSCTVRIRFVPTRTGSITATLAAAATPGNTVRTTLIGVGN